MSTITDDTLAQLEREVAELEEEFHRQQSLLGELEGAVTRLLGEDSELDNGSPEESR